jgi:hypothetical protein
MDKDIRHKLVTLNVVKSQEGEIDSRNLVKGGTNFFEDAAAKFNNVNFVPESLALPNLHEDFAVLLKLFMWCCPSSPVQTPRMPRTRRMMAHPTI